MPYEKTLGDRLFIELCTINIQNIVSTISHSESHALSENSARHFPYQGNTTRDYVLKQLKHRKLCFVQ